MQRINVNIERIVMQGIELPADRAQRLKEHVRLELEQGLRRAERPPVPGRDVPRTAARPVAVRLREGTDGEGELARQLARTILNTLRVSRIT